MKLCQDIFTDIRGLDKNDFRVKDVGFQLSFLDPFLKTKNILKFVSKTLLNKYGDVFFVQLGDILNKITKSGIIKGFGEPEKGINKLLTLKKNAEAQYKTICLEKKK